MKKNSTATNATAANVGYEAQLWQMTDALRGSMDAVEYKHVCLGLLFLKYITDTFHNDRHPDLKADLILANPPFNISDWGGERLREDKRWQYGVQLAGGRLSHAAPRTGSLSS
jgi:type I restriction-modification system DNA methylase subunit